MNRRSFVKKMGIAGVATGFMPSVFAMSSQEDVQKKPLNIAFVGTGLMGGANMRILLEQMKQNCDYVCDVDTMYGAKAQKFFAPKAKNFIDYREMFEKVGNKLDGVVISTPDNSHFAIAMEALKYKIPVFVEKPLCYSIEQIRILTKTATKVGVPTQMGNFVHCNVGIDYVREWINAGAIGTVREIRAWTCRPLRGCNQPPRGWKQWPTPDPIPSTLDWDKWLNTTEYSDFYKAVVPLNWRRFYKFGSGSLGDIGCHILDVPISALNLPAPIKVSSRQRGGTSICVPLQDEVVYFFPTSSQNVPVRIVWNSGVCRANKDGSYPKDYDKSFLPELPQEYLDAGRDYRHIPDDGMFIIGDEGVIFSPVMHLTGKPVLLPKSRSAKLMPELDKKTAHLKRVPNIHMLDFLRTIKGEKKQCMSDFSVSGPLSETIQLGNVALQTNKDILWNSKKMQCVGVPEADKFIRPSMRNEYITFDY